MSSLNATKELSRLLAPNLQNHQQLLPEELQVFSAYLKVNTTLHHYKDQLVNPV
jgi:hypothetical protein